MIWPDRRTIPERFGQTSHASQHNSTEFVLGNDGISTPHPHPIQPLLLYDFALFQPFEPHVGWLMNIYFPLLPFDGAASWIFHLLLLNSGAAANVHIRARSACLRVTCNPPGAQLHGFFFFDNLWFSKREGGNQHGSDRAKASLLRHQRPYWSELGRELGLQLLMENLRCLIMKPSGWKLVL